MFGCSEFALAVFDFGDICDIDIGSSDAKKKIISLRSLVCKNIIVLMIFAFIY